MFRLVNVDADISRTEKCFPVKMLKEHKKIQQNCVGH